MRKTQVITLLVGVLFAVAKSIAMPFTDVYTFGDSLSGTGNMLEVSNNQLPDSLSGPPYFEGRASNGPIYIDFLAPLLGGDSTASEQGGTVYAYGGARTNFHPYATGFSLPGGQVFPGIQGPKSILEQVDQFKIDTSGNADPDALYVMFGGANNVQTAIVAASEAAAVGQDPSQAAQAVIEGAINDIGTMLQDLVGIGAREFMVVNVPAIGRVPRLQEADQVRPGTAALATSLSLGFNTALEQWIAQLSQVIGTDVNFRTFNLFSFVEQLFVDETLFGLSLINKSDRCYTGDDVLFTGGGTICSEPDQYLFWDGVHPTTVVHEALANQMHAAILQQIPEPPVWLLLLLGFAGFSIVRANPDLDIKKYRHTE